MSKYTADLTDARWYFMVYESYLHKTVKKTGESTELYTMQL